MEGEADRVFMGYLQGTFEALPAALSSIRPAGGIILFHEAGERRNWLTSLWGKFQEMAREEGYTVDLISSRVVKPYSGRMVHAALEVYAKTT